MAKVVVANDHGAVELAAKLIAHLKERGYEVNYLGTDRNESVDYPDKAKEACIEYLKGGYEFGILLCGTGIGISIAANKCKGIRAALCGDVFSAKMSREHNNANVLCMGERVLGVGLAEMITDAWLETEFAGGRHERRVNKIMDLEAK